VCPGAMGCMSPLSVFFLAGCGLAGGVLGYSTQPVRQSIDGLCTSADPRVAFIRTVPILNDILCIAIELRVERVGFHLSGVC